MEVKLLGHTQLSSDFTNLLEATDAQQLALSAIRTCYSPNKPSEIVPFEGDRYFGKAASDGKEGTDADRLIRHIINSGHTSTLEHINFTFAIEGVSRSLLAQLTRHRHFSYSVQSQRYVKFGSNDKSEGYSYVTPHTVKDNTKLIDGIATVQEKYDYIMEQIQDIYDELRNAGVPAEDVRYILPNAATCNLVFTGNLRGILDFYSKRGEGTHAQWEIKELAELLKERVIEVESWTKPFFKVEK